MPAAVSIVSRSESRHGPSRVRTSVGALGVPGAIFEVLTRDPRVRLAGATEQGAIATTLVTDRIVAEIP
jgi:hypothetical protein